MDGTLNFAMPELGGGALFRQLSASLAARGVADPAGLAAYIATRNAGARSLANDDPGIYLAAGEQGSVLTCPECGHSGPASRFGASGTGLDSKPAALNTQLPNTAQARQGAPLTVSGKAPAHALANTGTGINLAAAAAPEVRRYPVSGPQDVIVARQEDGSSVLRHRYGGGEIAKMRQNDRGQWISTVGGKDQPPRTIQRTALDEAVNLYNSAVRQPHAAPAQPAPQHPQPSDEAGPAVTWSAGLATPAVAASDGARVTTAGGTGDGDPDTSGLSPKALAVYTKLKARGFPAARALAFARNSERFTAKAGS